MATLATLAGVKAYLAITTSGQDQLIPKLIERESKAIEDWCGRNFAGGTKSMVLNGSGTQRLVLPYEPIIAVTSLKVDGVAVAASSGFGLAGYSFDEGSIWLVGTKFTRSLKNVEVTWEYGYRDSETAFIPAGNTPTLTPSTGGRAIEVVSVTKAGVAMVEVGSSPAAGQFSFADGTFTFAAADSGAEVTMTYGYVPGPVEQACIEMIGLDLKARDNLGISSKTLANESIAYTDKGMSASVKEMLQPYRRMGPLWS